MSEAQSEPQTTLTSLPLLPLPSSASSASPDWYFIHLLRNLLTAGECASIIATHQDLVPADATPSTRRDREVFDDAELGKRVWERMRGFYGGDGKGHGVAEVEGGIEGGRVKDADGQWWRATCLNERWRLCRYESEGKFAPHQDGRRFASLNEQSFMAVNIYLNTVPAAHGGATRALSEPPEGNLSGGKVLGSVQPELGMAAVFRDCLWHDGEVLSEGIKYLLRTDIMYERETPFEMWQTGDDEAEGRKALALAEGLEDAGNYEEAVKWYKKAFRLAPGLERGA